MDAPEVIDIYPDQRIAFTIQFEYDTLVSTVWTSMHFVGEGESSATNIRLMGRVSADTISGPKIITVEFRSEARVPAIDGVYRLGPIYVRTPMGRTLTVEDVPEVSCRVHRDEPTQPPRLAFFSWD
jgi:hypothetical protein